MLDIKTIQRALSESVIVQVQKDTGLGYATIHAIARGTVTDPKYSTQRKLSDWVYKNKQEMLEDEDDQSDTD